MKSILHYFTYPKISYLGLFLIIIMINLFEAGHYFLAFCVLVVGSIAEVSVQYSVKDSETDDESNIF